MFFLPCDTWLFHVTLNCNGHRVLLTSEKSANKDGSAAKPTGSVYISKDEDVWGRCRYPGEAELHEGVYPGTVRLLAALLDTPTLSCCSTL